MSESERAAALEAIQLELFALDREYGDLVADFYAKRREILKRRKRLLIADPKTCRKCDEKKDADRFYRDDRYSDCRRPYCIDCDLERMKRYNEARRKGNVISKGKAA